MIHVGKSFAKSKSAIARHGHAMELGTDAVSSPPRYWTTRFINGNSLAAWRVTCDYATTLSPCGRSRSPPATIASESRGVNRLVKRGKTKLGDTSRVRDRRPLRRRDLPERPVLSFRAKLAPAELFVGSFLLLIFVGTLILALIPGLYRGESLNWTDAVFTSTSAVCVTGLIVVDTATYFTWPGQAVILLLIQVGGLGMMVLASVVISALGGRTSMRSEGFASDSRSILPQVGIRKLMRDIFLFTMIFELAGAVLLYAIWVPRLGWREAIWPSVFHSVSAFCNAGFSTNTLSLVEFQDSPMTIAVISGLIVCGGLGFVTIEDLYLYVRYRRSLRMRLSLHSKLVIGTSLLLIFIPWPMFAAFEWHDTLSDLSISEKLTNSLFMSVTARTAGFNSIDYAQASDDSNFLTIILMMIGGSPGSTAGGMKTTTFAILGLLAWASLRSSSTVNFGGRSVPESTVRQATSLFVITTGIVVFGVFALVSIGETAGEGSSFLARAFEVVSAFNTVGLSMGLTTELSWMSRWVLIFLMFAGRTGPLAIASVLIVRLSTQAKYRLAYESVMIG